MDYYGEGVLPDGRKYCARMSGYWETDTNAFIETEDFPRVTIIETDEELTEEELSQDCGDYYLHEWIMQNTEFFPEF